MQRLQQNLAADEIRERERRQILRRDVLADVARDEAIAAASRTALLGMIPAIILFAVATLARGWTGAFQLLFGVGCFFIPALIITPAIGLACGLGANWWFRHPAAKIKQAAIAMALISDTILLAWVIVLTRMP
jgi:uncharacterized membrane protein SpoIIM required for sporulation